jgi:hypothetical protein
MLPDNRVLHAHFDLKRVNEGIPRRLAIDVRPFLIRS